MKANEAPEKIWIRQDTFRIPWSSCIDENGNYGGIEYIRTDAFIDKACEWLKEYGGGYWMDDYDLPTDELVNDFRNYMKGE